MFEVLLLGKRAAERGRGFTLIEILVVIAILLIITSFGLFVSLDFYKSNLVSSERDTLVAALRRARGEALVNERGLPHGLHLSPSDYVVFAGSDYASRAAQYDENIPSSAGVTVIAPGDIVFSQLAATSSASGTFVITDGVRSSTVSVNFEGRISW